MARPADGPDQAMLPEAVMPLLVRAAEWMLQHSAADGHLKTQPGESDSHNWNDLAALAVVYTTEAESNPWFSAGRGDRRVADLIRRAGRALAADYADPALVRMDTWWYDDNRPDEWTVEHWLFSYELLNSAGAHELTAGWEQPLRQAGEAYDRYCRQVERLRQMTSPNLKISTNHFAYFAADLIRLGQVFGRGDWVDRGLATARKIAAHQHPDGYWPESHGPTTSYNQITTGAIGLCQDYTPEPIFEGALQRALEFHSRYCYPDGISLETIDQRVRYPSPDGLFIAAALSRWPAGRGLAEAWFAREAGRYRSADARGSFGRLATLYRRYYRGPVAAPFYVRPAYIAQLRDLPGGAVKREPWMVGLCGIPSRPRNHRFTLDRQNLLSIWHRRCGLIVGGGNSRDDHESATFFARIMNDPAAMVHGLTHEEVYLPINGELKLRPDGGTLEVDYAGFDATIWLDILDDHACRVRAFAGTLPANDPILFNPNILVDGDQPIRTARGLTIPTGEAAWELNDQEIGGWFGQGGWRIEVAARGSAGQPAGPSWRLRYPAKPFRPNPATVREQRLAVLTIPVTNRRVELTVRVEF